MKNLFILITHTSICHGQASTLGNAGLPKDF